MMRIHSLSISNFRGYRDQVVINFDDLTVFVGKNDSGKSTILEALDIFFNEGKGVIKLDKNDVNVRGAQSGDSEIVLSVTFDDLPKTVVIDASSETTLGGEYLLNRDGRLEIVKRFASAATPKVFIRALHPSNPECIDLLQKKNTELKKILQNNKIECDNQASNVSIRRAIWRHFSDSIQLQEREIDASKEDAKKIWEKLLRYLPAYSLFQSDRKNSDSDSEVQDPLQEAVKQIINDPALRETLASVANEVMEKLQEVSLRTLEKLKEMAPEVASSLNPIIPDAHSLKWQDVFKKVSISGDGGIPINKRGSGVKRLVLLNFFRAEAEYRLSHRESSGVIYAIEEPETSQHYANQRLLIQSLKKLAKAVNTQVILTTHSGIVVKQLDFSNLRVIIDSEQKKIVKNVDKSILQYPSLNEVNYVVFDEISEEYHNELYGFIEAQNLIREYKAGKQAYPYRKMMQNGGEKNLQLIRTEIIRHQIHHPENGLNQRFSLGELKESIDQMRNFLRNVAVRERGGQ